MIRNNLWKRIIFSCVFVFSIQFAAYAGNSQNNNMIVYSYGPRNLSIIRIYEIEFYQDGLIKSIYNYVNCGIGNNPDAWDKNDCLLTEFVEVKREGNNILMYVTDVEKTNEAVLEEIYEIGSNSSIEITLLNKSGRKDRIIRTDINGSYEYYYEGEIAYTFLVQENLSELHYEKSGSVTSYLFDPDGIFLGFIRTKADSSWMCDATFLGGNYYAVVKPSTGGEPSTYLSKFSIIMPQIEFTALSLVLNTLIVPSNEMLFLIPFVTRTVIP
jgi:hypothetical protein